MHNSFHPHQAKGIRPTPQLVSQPRCPISNLIIAPGDGQHVVGKDPETGKTRSFYISSYRSFVRYYRLSMTKIEAWLDARGLKQIQ